jgi:CSLREA domain-containing protein
MLMSTTRARVRRLGIVALASLMALPALVAAAAPADATTFTSYAVNSTADTTGGSLCTVQPPTAATPCTLRAAVAIANTSTGVTINVPAGTYTLSAGALNISKPMTIIGAERQPGASATTIDGAAKDRVFNITATGVTIDGVVARNGAPKTGAGGAIEIAKGATATITKSTVSGSTATQGAGIQVDGTATITQDTINGNTASGKGGGLFAAGVTTVQNSTFDGNAANGGGGIAASANVTVGASTVVNNQSNNSNGGGLYRTGGTFTVSGTIVAGNNATTNTGRDCYGTQTFTGTNIVQSTPGCNPTGGLIIVADPLLGPLADNSGPTLTHRPLTNTPNGNSKAIDAYAPPCATAVDQRGIARPQPVGGNCDVGSVEIEPLGLDLTLGSSSTTIGAGTGTVPLGNIPPSALIPTPASGSSTQDSVVHWSVVHWSVVHWSVVHWSTVHWSVVHWSVVHWSGAEQILTAAHITDPLTQISLNDVALSAPGGWTAFLAGTQFAGVPLQNITLANVMPLIESSNLTLDQLDFSDTPIGSLPFLSLLLGPVPLKSIPLTPALETGTDQQRLAEWCTELKTAKQDPCSALGIDPNAATLSSATPLAISLAGFSLDSVSINEVLVKDVAANDATWFQAMPLASFGIAGTALSSIPVSSLPAGWIDCTKVNCATATLGLASQVTGAIDPTKTMYDLFTNATTVGLAPVKAFTLGDLVQGLVPPTALPWQNLNITGTPLQNAAVPTQPALTYTASVNIHGDRPAATTVTITLPTGFVYVPGTFKVDGVAQTDPSISNGVVTLNLGTLQPGPHTATIDTRAGLTLGPATATANGTATAGNDTATASSSNTVTVVESFENGGTQSCGDLDACDSKTLQPDTLYIAHISSPTDRDIYTFTVPPTAGSKTRARILLSNIPQGADFDLALYGPQTQFLRNPPQQSIQPVADQPLSLYPTGDHVAPDIVNDVPLTPPAYAPSVIQVSANRGNADEEIDTGSLKPGQYAVQVSGYNGSWSNQPYALRMTLNTFTPPACAAPVRAFPDGGTLSDITTLGANPHVLFIVPQHHLYQTYGNANGQMDNVIADLQTLAQKVGGTILAVDNIPAVQSAYAAWDANSCDADAANAVVHAIGAQIDAARANNPNIDSIVLVGDDSVLPMARIPDRTLLANEQGFGQQVESAAAGQLHDNALSGTLSDGYFLSDDAYGTARGISVDDHELFVPDVALGRLVETPTDIDNQINTYLNPQNNGTLDPSTASSALVTGYDFMADGAQGVAAALTKNGKTVDSSLIGNGWSGNDFTTKLLGGTAPGIVSMNSHFDETHLQAPNGDLVNSSVLADPANAGKLSRRLLFSMGCHSGLSVDDVTVGTQLDWPQAITGAAQGGVYEGNTGYGYGDDQTVALSERLMGLYAQALDGTVSVGRALMLAKQQYLATAEVVSPYDEKVLEEATFYGLPLFNLASAVTQSDASVHALPMGSSSNTPQLPLSGTDPRTHLSVAALNESLDGSFNRHDTGNGSYYDVNGQTITAENRPIEPGTTIDVTQPNLRAHGVLITSLSTTDQANFTPKYFRPIADNSAAGQLTAPPGDAVFPAALSRVSHAVGAHGSADLALLTAGQARDPQGNGNVTQRLFDNLGGIVEYSTTSDTDFTAPTIFRTRGEIVGGTAGFTVDTDGTAVRAYVLYKPVGSNGAWKGVDLTPVGLPDGTLQWWGGGPINANDAEFFVQVLDASGNTAVSTNKVENFDASRVQNAGLTITLVPPAGVTPVNGWYSTTQAITAVVSGGTGTVTVSVDGSPFVNYPANGVPISGDGVHHVLAQDSSSPTAKTGAVDVLIDSTGPTVTASVDPGSSASTTDASNNIWYNGPVTLNIKGNDGVFGSGVASLAYHAGNAADTVITDASNPALVRSPLGDASTSLAVNSSATYTYKGTDVAGNSSASQAIPINIDQSPPGMDASCSNFVAPTKWFNSNQTVTCTMTDAGVGLADPTQSTVSVTTNVPMGSQTSTASTNFVNVCDRLNNCTKVGPFGPFKIDQQNPTITGTVVPGTSSTYTDASQNTWYGGPVTLHLAASDGTDGSNVASITYSSTGAFSAPATVVPSATADVLVSPASDGSSTASYFSTDNAENNSATGNSVIAIDKTPPIVKCSQPDLTKWYASNQTVNCTATDNGVGLNDSTQSMFSLSTSVPAGGVNANAPVGGPTQICDKLQNCAPVPSYSFKIDMQPPAAPTITTPAANAVYTSGQNVAASYSCIDGSAISGIASCVGTVAPGAAIDTTPGSHMFTVTATDMAGNKTVSMVNYTVGYGICLLYDPTKLQSTTGTVVIKLQLCDAAGNNLSSASIRVTAVYEDGTPGKLPAPNFQGSSNFGFEFRFSSGQYIYNLDPTQPPALTSGKHELDFEVNHTMPPVYAAPFQLK